MRIAIIAHSVMERQSAGQPAAVEGQHAGSLRKPNRSAPDVGASRARTGQLRADIWQSRPQAKTAGLRETVDSAEQRSLQRDALGRRGTSKISRRVPSCTARQTYGERMSYRLVIGNKNTSSWSLRPWLAMRHAGLSVQRGEHQPARRGRQGADPGQVAVGQGARVAGRRPRRLGQPCHPRIPVGSPSRGCRFGRSRATRVPRPDAWQRKCTRASSPCASSARWISWPAPPRST